MLFKPNKCFNQQLEKLTKEWVETNEVDLKDIIAFYLLKSRITQVQAISNGKYVPSISLGLTKYRKNSNYFKQGIEKAFELRNEDVFSISSVVKNPACVLL